MQREIARLHVDGDSVQTDGDADKVRQIMDSLRVLDLDTQQPTTFAEAPERWARFLPKTLRTPYLLATSDQFPSEPADD